MMGLGLANLGTRIFFYRAILLLPRSHNSVGPLLTMVHSRDVSFVDHLELPFGGRAFSHAVALGDVTGDGDNELVTASTEGTYIRHACY